MRKLFSKRLLKRTLAVMFAMVMVMPLLAISASADEVLATPVLIQKGENTDTPGSPGNPAKHTQFRSLIFNPVEGATGYNVYAYATKADAEAQENAVAVAENVGPTIESTSTGGTMGQIPMVLEDDEVLIDVRLIGFSDLDDSGATRDLPEGYTPAGLGDTYYPGDGTGNTTNLKPGQYWFTLQAVDAENPDKNSAQSDIYADGDAFSIAAGPDEGRDLLESYLATGALGTTAEDALRIVDLRGIPEFGDEGYLRFSERISGGQFNTVESAEELFGHLDDKSAVTIFVLCRGGGRAVTAARHLSNAGYTNVINIQGVNQITFGLMYDDPSFRFRQVDISETSYNDGDLAPGTNVDSPAGITFDEDAGALYWYNVPQAKFNVYAFASEEETDVENAVAVGTISALGIDLTGGGADWRFVRKFNLSSLDLEEGTYFIRVQALPSVDAEVRGYTPETIWGAASVLSDAVKYVYSGETAPPDPVDEGTFSDVKPDAWCFDAVEYAAANGLFRGISDTEFGPDIAFSRGMLVTVLYRLEEEPEVEGESVFADTAEGAYYIDAVIWASDNEIVNGYEDGTFAPDKPITREELAVILYRYSLYKEYDVSAQADLADYTDADAIGEFAAAAMKWANAEGIITGRTDTTLVPQGTATRAEAATMLMRFLEDFVKEDVSEEE